MCKVNPKFVKRREGKDITSGLLRELLTVKDSPLERSYRLTYSCSSRMQEYADGSIRSTFCNNRWCVVCGRIRSAKARNNYIPEVRKFKRAMFVTLTRRTVTAKNLPGAIKMMEDAWRSILQSREGKKRKMKGIRKGECNVSKGDNNKFHYHLHILMDGKEDAEWLVSQWLEKMGKHSTPEAQDIREADEGSYDELFKYATKSITKTENGEGGSFVSAVSLDTIYRCLKNKRTFQTFGSIRRYSEEVQDSDNEAITEDNKNQDEGIKQIAWDEDLRNWVYEDGTLLVEYEPNRGIDKLIRKDVKTLVEA